ncbi:MAG: hypothetical protein ACI85O_000570 [Saprospiraceae bacterium]|jgi:hypothetical protein
MNGTLAHFMENGGVTEFYNIQNTDDTWVTKNDVWLRCKHENGDLLTGNLGVGFGSSEEQIGPELGLGHLLSDYSDDQVLIIKSCWGGTNLAVDFRPPSSGGTVGAFYTQMIDDINEAVANIATDFPDYDGEEIEMAGFCWFQGWNDGEEEDFLNEYEQNLINLISDVRDDLNTPELPVVIGLTGNGGNEINQGDFWVQTLQTILVPAQINAAEFTGHQKVNYADTRDFWREADASPEPDFVHHWRNNAESYLRIGNELGLKMIESLDNTNNTPPNIYPGISYGFNDFPKEFVPDNNYGAGYTFYSCVWPLVAEYPGFENYQSGLPRTWVTPQETGTEPADFYNTIEGGLGWWGDTRFGTATPKFIMGGVANSFDAAANGPGAGSSDTREDGHRDWDTPVGKYGVAQLSANLIWSPDGLNMEQGANGEFLGYGYHPLPLIDAMEQTNGADFATGNLSWTLFLNTTNFKGPATFFIPSFWTETVLNDPSFEGLFLDSRPSNPNMGFSKEYSASPAIVSVEGNGDVYGRTLPIVFPKTTDNTSELIRDVNVYSNAAKWDAVETWFNGGAVPPTAFDNAGTLEIDFTIDPFPMDGGMANAEDSPTIIDAPLNQEAYSAIKMSADKKVGYFEWDTNVINETAEGFVMPEFYSLNQSINEWEAISPDNIPASSAILENEPMRTDNNEDLPYLTPLEEDCHLFGVANPWNSPGPVSGPHKVSIVDGSELTYYWYKFIDQPVIIHANLPEQMRTDLQDRVEGIHTH